jgi:hypothetical protein
VNSFVGLYLSPLRYCVFDLKCITEILDIQRRSSLIVVAGDFLLFPSPFHRILSSFSV